MAGSCTGVLVSVFRHPLYPGLDWCRHGLSSGRCLPGLDQLRRNHRTLRPALLQISRCLLLRSCRLPILEAVAQGIEECEARFGPKLDGAKAERRRQVKSNGDATCGNQVRADEVEVMDHRIAGD